MINIYRQYFHTGGGLDTTRDGKGGEKAENPRTPRPLYKTHQNKRAYSLMHVACAPTTGGHSLVRTQALKFSKATTDHAIQVS